MSNTAPTKNAASRWQEIVRQQVESLQFGVVQIVIHEARVVQIEKTEKVRLSEAEPVSSFPKILPNQTTGGISQSK